MIFKATKVKSVRHAGMLARHLLRADENEIVDVLEIRGTARPDDLAASLRSMQRATDLTRGKTGLFCVAINPRDHEADRMTPQQWERSVQAFEEEFKLRNQPCAIVRHRKNNRSHLHAVYQLTDIEMERLIDIKNDYRRCQALGRRLEREFGHELTTQEPSRSSYTRDEQQQAKRLGQDVIDRRNDLRADFDKAKDLDEFRAVLDTKGYTIAKGDRAGVVLIDAQGEVFGMTRELGIKAADVKRYIGREIDRLPTVEQAKNRLAVQKEKTQDLAAQELPGNQELAVPVIGEKKQEQQRKPEPYSYSYTVTFKPPVLPPQDPEKKVEKVHELSDSQDRAAEMLKHYRQRQADREQKMREAIEQRDMTDPAEKMLREYRQRQQERKRDRNRGLDLEL